MLDLAPITRHLRAKASSHLLVAAVHHFNLFDRLSGGPLSFEELRETLGLKQRPARVLFPALCAMGLLEYDDQRHLRLTELGRFLASDNPHHLRGYTGLEAQDPGVLQMTSWLRNDGPEDLSQGLSYVKDDQAQSPMDDPESARYFTLALAGRAKYLSPIVAAKMPRRPAHLVDVAAGTGYYTYEWLRLNPDSTATIMDRPEVLRVAREILDGYDDESLAKRVSFYPGDMFADEIPQADLLIAASLFHDWPEETCVPLMQKFARALTPGGQLWVHDAFLNDELDGPLAVTDYSAMLFLGTRGRCYSRAEYRNWYRQAGLQPTEEYIPTLMDYGLIYARKG